MKKLWFLSIPVVVALGYLVVFAPQCWAQGKLVLKAGSSTAETHPYNLGLQRFKEIVEKGTGGRIEIQIFHSSALGAERELAEGMQIGSVDIVISSTGPLGGFVPQMNVVDLPFLFRDKAHAYRVLDGPIGASLLAQLERRNIIGLAFWENGFRHITNARREIRTPADLKGLKLRTMENRVHMAAFRQLEAAPTPMAFSEVFTALQNRTLDGQENPIPVIYTSRFYEVQRFLSLTGHVYSPAPLMVGRHVWDRLTDEQKALFRRAAVEVREYQRDLITKQENEQVDRLRARGMTVTNVDKSLFQQATLPVYAQFEKEFGKDLIDRIVNTR
jgi:tripartite ATP-independent transporter DctP family solute receptor